MKQFVLKTCRALNRFIPMPYKVMFVLLYVMAYTVGVRATGTIVYRFIKEVKALNLSKPTKRR